MKYECVIESLMKALQEMWGELYHTANDLNHSKARLAILEKERDALKQQFEEQEGERIEGVEYISTLQQRIVELVEIEEDIREALEMSILDPHEVILERIEGMRSELKELRQWKEDREREETTIKPDKCEETAMKLKEYELKYRRLVDLMRGKHSRYVAGDMLLETHQANEKKLKERRGK